MMEKNRENIPNGVIHKEIDYTKVRLHRNEHPIGSINVEFPPIEPNEGFLELMTSQRIQDPTSSQCVAQTAASDIENDTGIIISAAPIFDKRAGGKGSYGMSLNEIVGILTDTGTTAESLCRSLDMTDAEMDAETIPASLPFKTPNPDAVYINPKESDVLIQMAEVINGLNKKLYTTFGSNGQEWQLKMIYIPGSGITFYHCTSGQLPRTDVDGTPIILERDTCGQNTSPKGYRKLTQEFIQARCTGIMYISKVSNTIPTPISDSTAKVSNPIVQPQRNQYTSFGGYIVALCRYFFKRNTGENEPTQ